MNLSIPALQTLDRFTSVLMDTHGVMLGAKFVPTGNLQITYANIDVKNRCNNLQRDWLAGGPGLHHQLNVRRYIESGNDWYVFDVLGKEYCVQSNDLRDFIRADMQWDIEHFDDKCVKFVMGNSFMTRKLEITFNLNVD